MVKNQGRRNRQRGQEGEREVCALLSDAFGVKVKRALGQERDSGTDILSLPPFRIEVKRRKRIAGLYEWLAQAGPEWPFRVPGPVPALMLRGDDKTWLVVMHFTDWVQIAREEIAK